MDEPAIAAVGTVLGPGGWDAALPAVPFTRVLAAAHAHAMAVTAEQGHQTAAGHRECASEGSSEHGAERSSCSGHQCKAATGMSDGATEGRAVDGSGATFGAGAVTDPSSKGASGEGTAQCGVDRVGTMRVAAAVPRRSSLSASALACGATATATDAANSSAGGQASAGFISTMGGCECAVCAEDVAEGQPAVWLACHHLFHAPCIRRWCAGGAGGGPTCPLCRAPILPMITGHDAPVGADCQADEGFHTVLVEEVEVVGLESGGSGAAAEAAAMEGPATTAAQEVQELRQVQEVKQGGGEVAFGGAALIADASGRAPDSEGCSDSGLAGFGLAAITLQPQVFTSVRGHTGGREHGSRAYAKRGRGFGGHAAGVAATSTRGILASMLAAASLPAAAVAPAAPALLASTATPAAAAAGAMACDDSAAAAAAGAGVAASDPAAGRAGAAAASHGWTEGVSGGDAGCVACSSAAPQVHPM